MTKLLVFTSLHAFVMAGALGQSLPERAQQESQVVERVTDFLELLDRGSPLCLTDKDGLPRRLLAIRSGISLVIRPDALPSRYATASSFDVFYVYSDPTKDGWVALGRHAYCSEDERIWAQERDFVQLSPDNRMLMWFPGENDAKQEVHLRETPRKPQQATSVGKIHPRINVIESRCFPVLSSCGTQWYEVYALPVESSDSVLRGWIEIQPGCELKLRTMLYISRFALQRASSRMCGLLDRIGKRHQQDALDEFIRFRDSLVEGCPQARDVSPERRRTYLNKSAKTKQLLYSLTEGWAEERMHPETKGWYQNGAFYWIPLDQFP